MNRARPAALRRWRLWALLLAACGGCQLPPPRLPNSPYPMLRDEPAQTQVSRALQAPVLQPFADGQYWVLVEPLSYQLLHTSAVLTVPAGFVTDFATVPAALCAVLPPTGRYLTAAIVHDYLYWDQSCSRADADRILEIAMEESQVDIVSRTSIYAAVRAAGGGAWDANAADKAHGGLRVLPPGVRVPPTDQPWLEYAADLRRRGVADAAPAVDLQAFCGTLNGVATR